MPLKEKPKRSPGRPAKPAEARRRNNLTLRIRDKLREDLASAAVANQHSLSEEAELRLERSFERESLLVEALDLAFGRQLAGLLLLIGEAMEATALRQAHRSGGLVARGAELLVPEALKQASMAAAAVLDWARSTKTEWELTQRKRHSSAEMVTAHLLTEIEGYPVIGGGRPLMAEIRDRVAPFIQRRGTASGDQVGSEQP